METVGIRQLKARLSSYIDKARKGERIIVTDRGIEVAVINPVSRERRAIMSLIKAGVAQWSGGKPRGLKDIRIRGKAISETILQERQ